MSDVQLACCTVPWGPDAFVQAIEDVSQIGYDGVECPAIVVQQFEDRLHVFEEILESSGLRLSGLIQRLDLLDRESADEQVERAVNSARFIQALGNACLSVFHGDTREESLADEEWATFAAIVQEIGLRCRELGVEFCYMPRAMHAVSTEKEIARLMATTDAEVVRLAVDTAELQLAGVNPERIIRAHPDRIGTVRLRDVSGSKRRSRTTSLKRGSTPQFGRGAVKIESVIKTLLKEGAEGWIVIDVSGETHVPGEAAAQAFRYMVRKSGLFSSFDPIQQEPS